MQISANLKNQKNANYAILKTENNTHSIKIPPGKSGYGSGANGGELLFLALAACYCNDIYREAGKQGITVESVEVEVKGDFDSESSPASNIIYSAVVKANAKRDKIIELMNLTDKVTEIQNTLRTGVSVTLANAEAISV
ncbi:MAG: OsmC family protein [Ignavibacteriaceae bacterium]